MQVVMPGSPGRTPFAGCVRGVRQEGGLTLGWAGRIAASAGPVEAWEAAEALRDTLAVIAPGPRDAWLRGVFQALPLLPPRWIDRGDLSLLLVARDADGVRLTGVGLADVLVLVQGAFVPALPRTSPLRGEPGPLPDAPVLEAPLRDGAVWLGLAPGMPVPDPVGWAAACGVHP